MLFANEYCNDPREKLREYLRSNSSDWWKSIERGSHRDARIEWENALMDAVQQGKHFTAEDVETLARSLSPRFVQILNRTVTHCERTAGRKGRGCKAAFFHAASLLFAGGMLFLLFKWIHSIPLAICEVVR